MEKCNGRARRGLKISRKKTEYLGCNEHQDAEIHLPGETVKRLVTFKYQGSTLAEHGEQVTQRVRSGWKNWKRVSVWSVMWQKKLT